MKMEKYFGRVICVGQTYNIFNVKYKHKFFINKIKEDVFTGLILIAITANLTGILSALLESV